MSRFRRFLGRFPHDRRLRLLRGCGFPLGRIPASHLLRRLLRRVDHGGKVLLGGGLLNGRRCSLDGTLPFSRRVADERTRYAASAQGKVRIQSTPIDLAAVVRQTVDDYRGNFENAGVVLRAEHDDELPISGDRTRLAQVIGNLLHNAAKFTPNGGEVIVKASADNMSGHAVVAVTDTGVGMPTDILAKVFDPFIQDEQGIDRAKGGLGLGLALAKAIVELHEGDVAAHSPGIGLGSTFTVRLPLASLRTELNSDRRSTESRPNGEADVLIVEDNADAARSLEMLLRILGCRVRVSSNAAAAIGTVQEARPDVVMSDLGLPGTMDGYELARRLRSADFGKPLRLVAISGYGQPGDFEKSREAGFDVHLVKPVDLKDLQDAIGF